MAKLNKDGIEGGKLLSYAEHTKLLQSKRKKEKLAKEKADAAAIKAAAAKVAE